MITLLTLVSCSAFQSTHPQGVGQEVSPWPGVENTNFNPPTRKGWDADVFNVEHLITIISIHPPARGGTERLAAERLAQKHFNPPTRKGWDQAGSHVA